MAQAKRDDNFVTTLLGVDSIGFSTPTTVAVNTTTHAMIVEATISTAGLATSTIQTDGTQKTQIVDAGGDAVTVTGGKLDVNATVDTTGLATSAKQDTQTTALGTLLTTAAHDAAFGTAGTADTQVRSIQGIASMTPIQVSQATASNLNATVVGTGTFVTQATLAAETTKVIGTINIAAAQTLATVTAVTTVSTLTGGGVAHDSADSGNPHKVGFKAYSPDGTTPGTAVAELDRTDAKADLDGRLFVNPTHPRDLVITMTMPLL